MIFFIAVIVLITLTYIYMSFEAGFLKVEYIDLSKDEANLKLLHFSDIHIKLLKVSYLKIREVVEQEKPDLIIMTGDYIDCTDEIDKFLKFLDSILNGEKVFMTLGNHDNRVFKRNKDILEKFIQRMNDRNIHIFENKYDFIKKNDKKYNFIGLSDIRHSKAGFDDIFQKVDNNAHCNIVFSHNPDIADKIKRKKVDILLCGHFHGGQISVPFGLEFKLLRKEKLGKMGYTRGLKNYDGIKIYLNRGIGNVCVPLRFMSRPEITVIKI